MKLVIQPHSDDAYLSLHQHIKQWVAAGEAVTILTMWERKGEGARYAAAMGCEHVVGYPDEKCHPELKPGQPWSSHRNTVILSLKGRRIREGPMLDVNLDQVYAPLGLEHLEHVFASDFAQAYTDRNHLMFYLDTPYWVKRTNQSMVDDFLEGKRIASYHAPCGRKYQDKWVKMFPTQSMFFFYNLDKLKHTPEMVIDA